MLAVKILVLFIAIPVFIISQRNIHAHTPNSYHYMKNYVGIRSLLCIELFNKKTKQCTVFFLHVCVCEQIIGFPLKYNKGKQYVIVVYTTNANYHLHKMSIYLLMLSVGSRNHTQNTDWIFVFLVKSLAGTSHFVIFMIIP